MDNIMDLFPHIDPYSEFGKSIIKEMTASLYKKLTSYAPKNIEVRAAESELEKRLHRLMANILQWSSETHFFGLSIPLHTDNQTIGLDISFNIREYSNQPRTENTISESQLFSLKHHFLIYGDPGSGKTTTLKRLVVQHFFTSTSNPIYDYPYLLRLKDIDSGKELFMSIADDFGFTYSQKKVSYEKTEKKTRYSNLGEIEYYDETVISERLEYFVGEEKLESYVSTFFEENKFLLIFDGLDEVSSKVSSRIQKQIEQLARQLHDAKIIITCRPGYLETRLESFIVTQICELSAIQIRKLCECWLENTDDFLNQLKAKSYNELSNRPLFLSYLLVLYKDSLTLPDSPKEVYEEIIDFYLVKWDKERGITRTSKYSNFRISTKKDFLSHLSFHLTYKIKQKVFTKEDFIEAYNRIYERFGLPKEEGMEVASEIESHTGIIVKAFFNKYEFSHLSIQEYFCANFIVKEPFTDNIRTYLKLFPSPLALVIAYSSNPSSWFANIIFNSLRKNDSSEEMSKLINVLLNRIIVEQAFFDVSFDFGVAILYTCLLCDTIDAEFLNAFNRFIKYQKNILPSIQLALKDFKYFGDYESTNKSIFNRAYQMINPSDHPIDHITKVALPMTVYQEYKKSLITVVY